MSKSQLFKVSLQSPAFGQIVRHMRSTKSSRELAETLQRTLRENGELIFGGSGNTPEEGEAMLFRPLKDAPLFILVLDESAVARRLEEQQAAEEEARRAGEPPLIAVPDLRIGKN